MCGAIKNDSIYNDASKALGDGACAVVARSLFHNLTVLDLYSNETLRIVNVVFQQYTTWLQLFTWK